MRSLALALAAFVVLTAAAAAGPPQNFVLREQPAATPDIRFADGDGKPLTLADFRGKIVLLNVWATWCAPCRTEMPTLDRLEAALGGPDFEVLALSIDRRGAAAVRKFFAETGVTHVTVRVDSAGKAPYALGVYGLPVTLLIDRQGDEVGRLDGPAEWDAPETVNS